jgi:hypothetical protein
MSVFAFPPSIHSKRHGGHGYDASKQPYESTIIGTSDDSPDTHRQHESPPGAYKSINTACTMDRVGFLCGDGSEASAVSPSAPRPFGALGFRGFVTLLVFTTATGNPRTLFMRSAKRLLRISRSGRLSHAAADRRVGYQFRLSRIDKLCRPPHAP